MWRPSQTGAPQAFPFWRRALSWRVAAVAIALAGMLWVTVRSATPVSLRFCQIPDEVGHDEHERRRGAAHIF